MLEYFSLYEEKNDGPAALIFGDGTVVGARLDRLGLRPLRTVETRRVPVRHVRGRADRLRRPRRCCTAAASRPAACCTSTTASGRSYSHRRGAGTARRPATTTRRSSRRRAGPSTTLPEVRGRAGLTAALQRRPRAHTSATSRTRYNQESFKFMMDPMLASGQEKISAMGYGNAINALSDQEGGVAKYFSQRFAQVTNPPLDSIREADGMTLRVALGAKPNSGAQSAPQIVVPSPILSHLDMLRIREQQRDAGAAVRDAVHPGRTVTPPPTRPRSRPRVDGLCDEVEAFAREQGGIAVLTDRHVATDARRAADDHGRLRRQPAADRGGPAPAGVGRRRERPDLVVAPRGRRPRFRRLRGLPARASGCAPRRSSPTRRIAAFKRFAKAAEKSLMKTMGRVGLCTVESYIGGEFFEPNYLDTDDPVLRRYFPNVKTPVGGVGFAVIAQAVADWHQRALTVTGREGRPAARPVQGARGGRRSLVRHGGRARLRRPHRGAHRVRHGGHAGPHGIAATAAAEPARGRVRPRRRRLPQHQLRAADAPRRSTASRSPPATAPSRGRWPRSAPVAPPRCATCWTCPPTSRSSTTAAEFRKQMGRFSRTGNNSFAVRGLESEAVGEDRFRLRLTGPTRARPACWRRSANRWRCGSATTSASTRVDGDALVVRTSGEALRCSVAAAHRSGEPAARRGADGQRDHPVPRVRRHEPRRVDGHRARGRRARHQHGRRHVEQR